MRSTGKVAATVATLLALDGGVSPAERPVVLGSAADERPARHGGNGRERPRPNP